jgi:alpha-amylase
MASQCDTFRTGSFLENHDLTRFPFSDNDICRARNAIAFTMLQDGIPIIYQGQEQHFFGGPNTSPNREALWLSGYPTNSNLYVFITLINKVRQWAIKKDPGYLTSQATYSSLFFSSITQSKGSPGKRLISVFTSEGCFGGPIPLVLNAADSLFTASEVVVDIVSCTSFTADLSGNIAFTFVAGQPYIFYPADALVGSGICVGLTGICHL